MLFRALFLFLPCLIAWSSPSLILLIHHLLLASLLIIPGVLYVLVTLVLQTMPTQCILSYFRNFMPRPGSSEDFLRSPLFAPLANNFLSCHVIFLLFTLRCFLPCSCLKKNSALKDIERPHEMVITGSKTPGL